LRDELRLRDREIYELQNATIIVDNDRLWELEQQVNDLEAELREARSRQDLRESSPMDWTFGAPPSTHHHRSRGFDADDEDQFGDATMAQLMCSTPSRARSSFPTPPATSPPPYGPGTPTMGRFNPPRLALTPERQPEPHATTTAGVQASLPDPMAQAEMESLQREARKLSETLDSQLSLLERISRRLPRDSTVIDGDDTVVVWGPEAVEKQVDAVMRTLSDRAAALTSLTTTISALGYPGNDASEMLTSLATSFRAARLELEYLTPGEITLPLTSRSAEVLDLLLVRLRELARKVKEGDDAIDEYHAIELNLRKQLDSRVSVMDDLKADLANKEDQVASKTANIKELEVANDRLKGAVEGYLRDISQLEQLVEKMESESTAKNSTIAERDASISELEGKLEAASRRASDLQDELEVVQASRKKHLDSVNRRSGEALALRDARVKELRDEVDRVNSSLRSAYETICRLRADHGHVERENQSLREAMGELQKVMKRSEELLAASSGTGETGESSSSPKDYLSGIVFPRLGSGSKRRRPDSGLGFMEADEVDI
jgi:chromosome segregation ATPase